MYPCDRIPAWRHAGKVFADEAETRRIRGDPATRRKLLDGLADKGFGMREPEAMQKLVEAAGVRRYLYQGAK